ncbi:hypothetical protein PC123_g6211 [Phytophthora cactorum]|nr:hypothetical protein PC123_g6211 [Phytophthora cactorum]
MRTERIQQAQDEEKWIADLKAYLSGGLKKPDRTKHGCVASSQTRTKSTRAGCFSTADGGGEVDRHAVRLETAGTEYRLFPTVHLSKLKLVKAYLDRPAATLTNDGIDRDDFDENLLAEESWEGELDDNEFEVERIADVRSGRRTRYG